MRVTCGADERAVEAWARGEFSGLAVGDARRAARAVQLLAAAARRPDGAVTVVCATDAARQGAYGLLANPAVPPGALGAAAYAATARRAAVHRVVVVALDESSLRIVDPRGVKGTGAIGAGHKRGRGFKVLNALALTRDGATLGLLDQQWWARTARVTRDRRKRGFGEKETRHWEAAAQAVDARLAAAAPGTRAWYQKDAGADGVELLLRDLTSERLMTVRAVYDRRVHASLARVRATLAAAPLAGVFELRVAARPGRAARTATLEMRHAEVALHLHQRQDRRDWAATVAVVWAREVGTTPAGETPLDWMLYTNYPVEDFADAAHVLQAYALRWRVEEFHFAWKSGVCRVERTELRAADRILKWATLLAVVATRVLQLRDASRATPTAPAAAHFDAWELRALVALRGPRRTRARASDPARADLTLAQAVTWIAELGGYTGRSSGGPPGTVTLRRGLEQVIAAATALRNLAAMEM